MMKTSWLSSFLRTGAAVLAALLLVFPLSSASAADATWHGEYFANQELAGSPAFTRSDSAIDFDWHLDAPDPRLPADHFSIRWTRSVNFAAGQWRFNVSVDDGVRLYIDGQAIIDQWRITAPITYSSSVWLAGGDHDLKLEYYENTERAQVRLWWESAAAAPAAPVLPTDHAGTWQGRYFDNADLSGDPKFERNDAVVYFDWGTTGPGGGLGGQYYSVRWYRKVHFDDSTYRFKIIADDGVRVWLDWAAIIDQWHPNSGQTYKVDKEVSAGDHEIVVEYYQGVGDAEVKFSWQDTKIDWRGNLFTCMRPYDSWIKIYRLAPNNQWEDTKEEGYGPLAQGGELKLFGVPIDATFGWDGQPFKIELWESGTLVRKEGDILAGQAPLRLQPDGMIQTTWPCGAAIPQP